MCGSQAENMVSEIKWAFEDSLKHVSWMDGETKKAAKEKVSGRMFNKTKQEKINWCTTSWPSVHLNVNDFFLKYVMCALYSKDLRTFVIMQLFCNPFFLIWFVICKTLFLKLIMFKNYYMLSHNTEKPSVLKTSPFLSAL